LKEGVRLGTWEYQAEDVFLEQAISIFSCGDVRKGKVRHRGQPVMTVAIKTVPGRSPSARMKVTELMRECRLLRELSHPCVRQFYGVCLMAQPHCFITEYVHGTPLDGYLREYKGNLRRDDLLVMVCCAGWGLEYLHNNKILHRDIAAKNCLYDGQYVSALVKLIGFSMSKKGTAYTMKTTRRLAIKWTAPETLMSYQYVQKSDVYGFGVSSFFARRVKLIGFSMSKKGTTYTMKTTRRLAIKWTAPETLMSYQYVQKSDVYGFGILIYEIFSAQEPYEGLSNFEAKALILDGVLNEFPGITPRKLSEVVRGKMWAMQPESRSAMFQVKLSSFSDELKHSYG
ncbi:protein tyrosine kinase, partial [Oesophagostomum dentatum]